MIELVLRVIVSLILAALDALGSPHPAQPPSESTSTEAAEIVPIAHGSKETAAVFSLLRAVDPCGLHDIAAATRITGDHADQIMPDESLSACQLRLNRQPLEPTWIFTTRVGITYGAPRRQSATAEEIDGRRVYREDSTDPHDRSCTYTRPVGTNLGISLTVSAPVNEPDARPCPIAKAYLLAAKSVTHLVLRAERRTEPRFALATVDPCAATVDVLRSLGVQGTAQLQAPYECRIQPDTPDGAPVTISFRFTADPTELAGADTGHQPVTIAGHAGVATTESNTGRCQLALAYDTNAVIQIDHTRFVQTIAIQAASCDQAKAVGDIVLNTIKKR